MVTLTNKRYPVADREEYASGCTVETMVIDSSASTTVMVVLLMNEPVSTKLAGGTKFTLKLVDIKKQPVGMMMFETSRTCPMGVQSLRATV